MMFNRHEALPICEMKIKTLIYLSVIFTLLTVIAACHQTVTQSVVVTHTPIPSTRPPNTIIASPSTFSGIEGFGSKTVGGRGGDLMQVTNLNDSGSGSLRACIEASGPRICVFTTGGTINVHTPLVATNPYLTIAGQTAPGGGITLKPSGNSSAVSVLYIRTHDVIVQYITLRAGPPVTNDAMTISSRNSDAYNIVIDHNSMSWGVDENLATWYDAHDITIQWNIFSEALNCSIHPKGCHSKGVMLGYAYGDDENKDKPGARDISFHHNLIAHSVERNPLVKTYGVVDVVNNVMYNPLNSFSHVDMENQITSIPANYIGNYFKSGPDTRENEDYGVSVSNVGLLGAEIFVQGNIGIMRPNNSLPEINIVKPRARPYVVAERHPTAPITTTSAFIAYDKVLAWAGNSRALACDGNWYKRRDVIDERIISEVDTKTGHVINDPSDVGGWIEVEAGTPCLDRDYDGMPDIWENLHGLDPSNPSDNLQDVDNDGYTNIEEYFYGSCPTDSFEFQQ